ncbi:MAG: TIGR01841 family phasin [Sphingomonadales bacterium]|nr:TIGR01841 family phasin [Sphingomonadales bacterium]
MADTKVKKVAKKKPAQAAAATQGASIVAETVNADTLDQGMTTMTDTVKTVAAEAAEKATEFLKDAQAKAQDAFAKSGETAKDVLSFHKANAEAVVEAAKAAAAGLQTAAQDGAALTRKHWDDSVAHVKALTALRSPADLMKAQADFIRTQFDAGVAEVSKASEFGVKLAGDVIAPLQNRYAVVAEEVKARLAA